MCAEHKRDEEAIFNEAIKIKSDAERTALICSPKLGPVFGGEVISNKFYHTKAEIIEFDLRLSGF
jgi:hypothetical protein